MGMGAVDGLFQCEREFVYLKFWERHKCACPYCVRECFGRKHCVYWVIWVVGLGLEWSILWLSLSPRLIRILLPTRINRMSGLVAMKQGGRLSSLRLFLRPISSTSDAWRSASVSALLFEVFGETLDSRVSAKSTSCLWKQGIRISNVSITWALFTSHSRRYYSTCLGRSSRILGICCRSG